MNITRSQSIMLTLVSLVLFFAVGIAMSFRGKSTVVQSAREMSLERGGESGEGAHIVLNDFHRSETKDGVKAWEVRGKKGEYFPAAGKAKVQDADLWLYRPGGDVIHLLADEGILHLDTDTLGRADLEGNVRVTVQNRGITIRTGRAIYSKADDSVRAPGTVTITSDVFDLSGTSLVAHVSTQEFHLEQNVKSILRSTKVTK